MTALAKPPHIQLLEAMVADMQAVDYVAALGDDLAKIAGLLNQDGTPGKAIVFRHARNLPPPAAERPCLCVLWKGNTLDPQMRDLNDWEQQRSMDTDLVLDIELPEEDSEEDPTGWLIASTMMAAAYGAVRADTSQTALLSDWVQNGDLTPDDDASGPDNARLVQGVPVLYRVLVEDPNTLLAQGVNGG